MLKSIFKFSTKLSESVLSLSFYTYKSLVSHITGKSEDLFECLQRQISKQYISEVTSELRRALIFMWDIFSSFMESFVHRMDTYYQVLLSFQPLISLSVFTSNMFCCGFVLWKWLLQEMKVLSCIMGYVQ